MPASVCRFAILLKHSGMLPVRPWDTGVSCSSLFDLRFINVMNEGISGLDGPELVLGIQNDQGRLIKGKIEN